MIQNTAWWLLAACLMISTAQVAAARTIVLTDEDCERMAVISADAPRMSWAATLYGTAQYSNHVIDLTPKLAMLIVYPVERIPAGQRITKAEWIVPYSQVSPLAGVRISVRRVLCSWGAGVSHLHRAIRPERLQWHTPGARGLGQDRASRATVTVPISGDGEQALNVTQDVELWYTGAAQNHGWMLTAEDEGAFVRMPSPFWGAPKGWKLRITFEPE